MHGVYHYHKGLGVDESVAWGDHFFVEALVKARAGRLRRRHGDSCKSPSSATRTAVTPPSRRRCDSFRIATSTCVLHCGDIEDSETVWLFQGFTAHFVFGNCDTERHSIRQAVHGIGETLHDGYGICELEGVKIAFTARRRPRLDARPGGERRISTSSSTATRTRPRSIAPARRASSIPALCTGPIRRHFVVLDLATRNIESVVVDA